MLILTGFVLFAAVLGAGADSGPEVATLQGRLRGRVRFTRGNRTFGAFEGIAFARPPLGELRFKVRLNRIM